jgi:hypothetical protein
MDSPVGWLSTAKALRTRRFDDVQMGPQCGEGSIRIHPHLAKFDDGYFGSCPAKAQLYRFVVSGGETNGDPFGFALLLVLLLVLLADGR